MRAAPTLWFTAAPAVVPLCPRIEAGLGKAIRAAQRTAAAPLVAGAEPAPRWTLKRPVAWVRERLGRNLLRETVRRLCTVSI